MTIFDDIRRDAEAGTAAPWDYRTTIYSDWGDVYAGEFRICQARDPQAMDDDILAEHRRNGTDPWEHNARRIARVPDLERIALAAEKLADAASMCLPATDEALSADQALSLGTALAAIRAAVGGKP